MSWFCTCLNVGGYFYHRGGQVGLRYALDLILTLVGAEAFGSALAAKEHRPLAEHRQAGDLDRTGGAHKSVGGDPVKIPHIHSIEAPVEGNRLHIDVRVQQLGGTGLDRLRPVDHLLGAAGGINAQIFNAVLIVRYITFKEFKTPVKTSLLFLYLSRIRCTKNSPGGGPTNDPPPGDFV